MDILKRTNEIKKSDCKEHEWCKFTYSDLKKYDMVVAEHLKKWEYCSKCKMTRLIKERR